MENKDPVISTVRPSLLEARGIHKRFDHVFALRGVNLDVEAGEIVGLVGDNGAGKSTLAKIIAGFLFPDDGNVFINGEPLPPGSAQIASKKGIEMVYQDLSLARDLDAASNLYLGRELVKPGLLGIFGFLERAKMLSSAQRRLQDLGIDAPASERVKNLSGGQQQAVAVARATHWATKIMIMDEPTAALGAKQKQMAMDAIFSAKQQGLGILLISHDLPSVLAAADRICVMRLGCIVANRRARELDVPETVRLMVG